MASVLCFNNFLSYGTSINLFDCCFEFVASNSRIRISCDTICYEAPTLLELGVSRCRTPALIITLNCVIFQIIIVSTCQCPCHVRCPCLFISQLLQCKWNFTIIEESLDWTIFCREGSRIHYWFKSSKIKLMSGSRYLFSNGILSHTLDVPPVKLFLEAHPGRLDTFIHLVK
jgi:hypothetical protein